jgi:hypothetical protein
MGKSELRKPAENGWRATAATSILRGCVCPIIVRGGLWSYARVRVGADLMRCLACGGEMMAVASDDAAGMDGFKYQALQCLSCESTERRLVFNRGLTETTAPPPGRACPPQPASSSPQRAPIAPARTWERAVEKLRSHQADLHARAHDAAKSNWNARFNVAWEKLGPTRLEPPPPANSPPRTLKELAWQSGRAQRARLRGSPSPRSRNRSPQPAVEPTAENVERFNRFWDSLGLNGKRLVLRPEASSASPEPLPRSLSLVVPVENLACVSAAARAISILRAGCGEDMGR